VNRCRSAGPALHPEDVCMHPHIVTVHAVGSEGRLHYIAMDLIRDSRTLETLILERPLGIEEIVVVMEKLCDALQHCHDRGILHGDIKSLNVMLDEDGEPLLADFGLACLAESASTGPSRWAAGTPFYMAPEQLRGEGLVLQSDIYSLGVVLYQAVSGVLPYSVRPGSTLDEIREATLQEVPRAMRLYRPDVLPALQRVVDKALSKKVEERYVSAAELAVDLKPAAEGRDVD